MNDKCSLNISESLLDISYFASNSWVTGFTESDVYFGIKYVEDKPKLEAMKRTRSEHDQRAYDKSTSSFMLSFMEKFAKFLDYPVKPYSSYKTYTEVLLLTVSAKGK